METIEYSFNYDTNKVKKYKQSIILIARLFNIPCIVLIFLSLYKQKSDYLAFLILSSIITFNINFSYMNRLVYYEMAFQGHIEVKMNPFDKDRNRLEDAVFNLAFLADRDQYLFLSLLENIVNGKGAIVSEVYEADWRKQYKSKI